MTGKYLEFKTPEGNTYIGKTRFCGTVGISCRKVDQLRAKRKEGTFTIDDVTYSFKMICANPEKRKYVPNQNGNGRPQREFNELPYKVRYGNHILVYSSYSNMLINTIAL